MSSTTTTALRGIRHGALALALTLGFAAGAAAQNCGDAVTVDPGDTLARISAECDVALGAVLRENPEIDDPNVIRVGQEIDIPDGADGGVRERDREPNRPETPRGRTVHRVSAGETLAGIAARYGVALPAILRLNPEIDDPTIIHVGQRIEIPGERRAGWDRDRDARNPRPDRPDRRDRPDRPDRRGETVRIQPRQGSVRTDVRIRATGYPPDATVEIGFGPPRSEYRVVERLRADARGRVDAAVAVPDWAESGRDYLFVVTTRDHAEKALSDRFTVRAERGRDQGGEVTLIRGTLTDEGVECQAMRGSDGTLYTLAGDTEGFDPGDRVAVKGRPVDMSVCMQGTTLEVEGIQPAHRGEGSENDEGDNLKKVHRVTGELIDGAECAALRTRDGTVYSLVGHDFEGFSPGDRVRVRGTEADASICMQGTATLRVREVRDAGRPQPAATRSAIRSAM